MPEFDLAAHQREKIRRLEAQVEGLERTNRKLYAMLALTSEAAVGQTEVQPLALLAVVEEMVG